jgi:hypothetical protein
VEVLDQQRRASCKEQETRRQLFGKSFAPARSKRSSFKVMIINVQNYNRCLVLQTVVVSTPLAIKLSASCAAKLVTKTEAKGGRMET